LNYFLSQGDFIALGWIRIQDPDPEPDLDPEPDTVKMDRIRQHWVPHYFVSAPAMSKNFDATPASTLLYTRQLFKNKLKLT
jgi:hypothetical protein